MIEWLSQWVTEVTWVSHWVSDWADIDFETSLKHVIVNTGLSELWPSVTVSGSVSIDWLSTDSEQQVTTTTATATTTISTTDLSDSLSHSLSDWEWVSQSRSLTPESLTDWVKLTLSLTHCQSLSVTLSLTSDSRLHSVSLSLRVSVTDSESESLRCTKVSTVISVLDCECDCDLFSCCRRLSHWLSHSQSVSHESVTVSRLSSQSDSEFGTRTAITSMFTHN